MDKARRLRWIGLAGLVIGGLLTGAASAWIVLTKTAQGEPYSNWTASAVTGSVDADPWTRAQVAISGLLALNKSQAIYFTRKRDDRGKPLSEDCLYRVSGGPLPGKWWSVTVYAADNFLPLNDDGALSFDSTEVAPDGQGRWSALLAAKAPASGAWASTRNAGNFDVTLRIYQPSRQAQANFATVPMPSITNLGCKGAQP